MRRLAVETAPGGPAGREVRLRGLEADGDGTPAISDSDNSQALMQSKYLVDGVFRYVYNGSWPAWITTVSLVLWNLRISQHMRPPRAPVTDAYSSSWPQAPGSANNRIAERPEATVN